MDICHLQLSVIANSTVLYVFVHIFGLDGQERDYQSWDFHIFIFIR